LSSSFRGELLSFGDDTTNKIVPVPKLPAVNEYSMNSLRIAKDEYSLYLKKSQAARF